MVQNSITQFWLFQFDLMSTSIRIKQKQNYEWNQDKKFLFIQVPLPAHTNLKKVDIYLSDLVFRVNSVQKNQIHVLDLAEEVDYRSPENKFILSNGLLHATIKKAQADKQWTHLLVQDLSLFDLKKRREESRNRYDQNIKSFEENKDKLRVQYDRKATQELMRFQQEEREKLEEKKKIEKEDAIREVFSNVNEKTGRIQKKEEPHKYLELQRDQTKWNEKEKLALSLLDQEEQEQRKKQQQSKKQKHQSKIIEEVTRQYQQEKITGQNTTMFTDQEIDKFQEIRQNINSGVQFEEVPIRKAQNQKVKFTQRVFPNLAARDHFYKQPPMPKNKMGKAPGGDLEQKNPLWLKDKGDSFFADKNYVSAIQAYSEALKADAKMTNALMNRSASYMKIFKLQQAINDCQQCLIHLQSQISGEESDQNHSRLVLAKIKTRKAVCLAWKGELEASDKVLREVLELQLTQDIKNQVNNCLEQIQRRQQSNNCKIRGDQLVKVNKHAEAIINYDKSIQIDENEYSYSNKVLCLSKCQRFKQAIENSDIAIKKLASFNLGSGGSQDKQEKQSSLILLKLYFRKAKALQQLNQIAQAKQNVRKGLTINAQDKDLQDYLKVLKKKEIKLQIKALKDQSASLIKESKIKEALQNYTKCLKLLQQNQDITEYLAILQNQCVCYQKLQMFDDVLSICIRILKLVNSIESKVLVFGGKKQTNIIDKQQLKKISVRTLVRRANAYIKTTQYYNAKSDLQKAFEISPEQSIRKQLQNLKEKLKG